MVYLNIYAFAGDDIPRQIYSYINFSYIISQEIKRVDSDRSSISYS